jgi:hypothetical protein
MKNFILIIISLCTALTLNAKTLSATPTIAHYILKYSNIAQVESDKSKIPASIILAQGILESGFGNSKLCIRSNNHFGIKWKSATDGDFVYSMDDDYDKKGKHIASKFVKYSSASESFQRHSQFIKTKSNYRELFKYDRTDFVSWAYGLRACGYSTDADYGVQLIKLIRKYNLQKYDTPQSTPLLANAKKQYKKKLENLNIYNSKNKNSLYLFLKTQGQCLEESMAYGSIKQVPIVKSKTKSTDTTNLPTPPSETPWKDISITGVRSDNRFTTDEQTPQYFW